MSVIINTLKPRPSSSATWGKCPASIKLAAYFREEPSEYAVEGTAAHFFGEMCLVKDKPAKHFIGETHTVDKEDNVSWTLDAGMAEYVQEYVNKVAEIAPKDMRGDKTFWTEKKLDMGFLHKGMDGTADALFFDSFENMLHVIDLKYGMGVLVDAECNSQLGVYALAAKKLNTEFEPVDVTVHIVQPRRSWYQSFVYTAEDLKKLEKTIKAQLKKAFADTIEAVPGDHCLFCKAKPLCPAYIDPAHGALINVEGLVQGSTDFDFGVLSKERLGELMKMADLVDSWASKFKKFALNWACNGGEIEGYKIVAGRAGSRKWVSEAEASAALAPEFGNYIYKTELLSPAALEKQVGKSALKDYAHLITQSDGNPTLVPLSDKRQSIQAEPLFGIIEE